MKDWMKISDQYIAECLKVGKFLNQSEIKENDNIDCHPQTIINNFGSLSQFQFHCMCEIAVWFDNDLDEFMEHMNIETKWDKNHPKEYRIA